MFLVYKYTGFFQIELFCICVIMNGMLNKTKTKKLKGCGCVKFGCSLRPTQIPQQLSGLRNV